MRFLFFTLLLSVFIRINAQECPWIAEEKTYSKALIKVETLKKEVQVMNPQNGQWLHQKINGNMSELRIIHFNGNVLLIDESYDQVHIYNRRYRRWNSRKLSYRIEPWEVKENHSNLFFYSTKTHKSYWLTVISAIHGQSKK